MNKNNPSTDDILRKYGAKIEKQMKGYSVPPAEKFSQSYERFRAAMTPQFSRYEQWCKAFGNFFTIKVGDKDKGKIGRAIEIAHLNLTPSEVVVFALSVLF